MITQRFKRMLVRIPGCSRIINTAIAWLRPQGEAGIQRLGHRNYIGGRWEEIGKLQLDFLVKEGLRPDHVLCDVACGSLRAGVWLIPYLNAGHYLGIEKEARLIDTGIEQELRRELVEEKHPEFVVSDSFEFERFALKPQVMIAQSLFTHLPSSAITLCLRKARESIYRDGRFYASFNEVPKPVSNPRNPHDHGVFCYTRSEMEAFGHHAGWTPEYIGDWGHPRRSMMIRYRAIS